MSTKNSDDGSAVGIAGIFIIGLVYNFWMIIVPGAIIILIIWLLYHFKQKGDISDDDFYKILVVMVVSGLIFGPKIWHYAMEWQNPTYVIDGNKESVDKMSRKLENQLKLISNTRGEYQNDIEKYSLELKNESQSYGINSLRNATVRMQQNIELIRQRDAYLVKLSEIESVTRNGLDESVYMSRKLAGAKGMARVLGSGQSLASDAEHLLTKYAKYTEELAINPKELSFKSSEEIWQKYK